MKMNFILFSSILALAAANSTPDSDQTPTEFGEYGNYGQYGSYDKYPEVSLSSTATPAKPSAFPNTFVAVTTRSGNPKLHLRPVSASNLNFYIGKETSTYCPLSDCSGFVNFTVFDAQPNNPNSGLGLFTTVPGGQLVYVTKDGQLGYTQAHSAFIPTDAKTVPFLYAPNAEPGSVGTLTFNGGGWMACPEEKPDDVFQIYSQNTPGFNRKDCTSVNIVTAVYNGNSTWQYV
ncbi:BgTH12-07361 [Blumeria graminis f. sp. triticale]|uniref:BgTH12-07361 n=1 Tax=Blumeria graminis f. sp. triticale TaxID=1689686 RepID=A0A9W4GK06_BLUGR|nr:BgTH12-07361 [Blumeria graminis f. sp. triticale]